MKIMVRETPKGMEVYVPKKDLEELVVVRKCVARRERDVALCDALEGSVDVPG